MSSFGLTTAADFLQKLRDERRDFVASNCLDARHAVNAVMTAYHLCEWVFGQNAGRFGCSKLEDFRDELEALPQSPIRDAGKVTNGTKHFLPDKIPTGKGTGAWGNSWGSAWGNSWGASYLWLDRDTGRQRAEDFIDELIEFWDDFFRQHGLKQRNRE
jgi:hypothetical protein